MMLATALRPRGFNLRLGSGRCAAAIALIGFVAFGAAMYGAAMWSCTCGSSKEDVALIITRKYVFEAFPAWTLANPSRVCPDQLAELSTWMNNKDTNDPWGSQYQWSCAASAQGARLVVGSAGEDRVSGTADDLRSDR